MNYTTILTPDLKPFGLNVGIRRIDSGVLEAAFREEGAAIRFQKLLNGAALQEELEPSSLENPGDQTGENSDSGWKNPAG